MIDDDISSVSSASSSSVPASPRKKRPRPPPLSRLDPIGIDPDELVGKKLIRISRSSTHPSLTLDFSDNTTAQVLVDGYSPRYKGVPKALEMDDAFQDLAKNGIVGLETLEIVDCAMIKLCDKAFQRKQNRDHDQPADVQWDQNHLAVAFKFSGTDSPRWHCVWATLAEHDESGCVFRSYDDVFLDYLQRSPRKRKFPRKTSNSGLKA